MTEHRRSYWKTVILATLASAFLLALAGTLIVASAAGARSWSLPGWIPVVGAALALPPAATCLLVAIGGLLCLRRDTLETRGKPYRLPDSAQSVPLN